MTGTRVVFAGCARSCASALPNVLHNVEKIASLYRDAAFIFVENDSDDDTKEILQAWCRKKPTARLIMLDGLAGCCPVRTIRLEKTRKQYLSIIRSDYADYTHLIVLDCDDVNAGGIDLSAVQRAIDFLESNRSHAGVFPGQDGPYYDIWALRHPERCPWDMWEAVFDYAMAQKVSYAVAFNEIYVKRVFSLPANAPPLEVDSAFGGIGIYKLSSVLRNRQTYIGHKRKRIPTTSGWQEVGWQVCEHVAFNAGFREREEKLFVLPYLVNMRNAVRRTLDFGPSSTNSGLAFDLGQVPLRIADPVGADRNQPCPCGSGRRYKHCHGDLAAPRVPDRLKKILDL